MCLFRSTVLTLIFIALNGATEGQHPIKHDTIKANGYTLIFSRTDSTQMTDIYADGALRLRMTDSIGNAQQKAMAIEKYLAKKFNKYFKANDSSLIVILQNGKELKFPKWDEPTDRGYNFAHYFSNIDYILLRVQWGEGNDWLLINRKNGFTKNIIGEPYISPSLKRILTVNSAAPGYGDSGIEMLAISGDTLKSEFKVLRNWGSSGAKWLTDDKAIIEEDIDESGDKKVYEVMQIKH